MSCHLRISPGGLDDTPPQDGVHAYTMECFQKHDCGDCRWQNKIVNGQTVPRDDDEQPCVTCKPRGSFKPRTKCCWERNPYNEQE